LHYPKALTQTLTGVYLAEVCLVGLFGLKGAYGPVVMTFGLIIFTALFHVSLNDALSPLLYNLPRTLAAEEELRKLGNDPFLASNLTDIHDTDLTQDAEDAEAGQGYDSDFDPSDPTSSVSHGEQNSRAGIEIEGADKALALSTRTLSSLVKTKYNATPLPSFLKAVDFWSPWITPDPNQKPNFVLRFLHPEIFESYHVLRDMIPPELREMDPSASYSEENASILKDAYSPPSIKSKSPRLWIPRDLAGVSRQEVAQSGKVVEISDEGASLDANGRLGVDLEGETEKWVCREGEGSRVKF
jgi:calcium permeable stress-gated cation channel